ncbi:MAG: lysylphosphatidylglycerol synthase transmembrane domain-containing protein [Gemmatimonadota bacterium]
MRGHRGKTVVGLLITVALLAWVLRDVSPAEIASELREARVDWLLLAVALATFSFVLRAWRWRVLLEPSHPGTELGTRFGAVCIGFAVNNLLPARLGEFTRAYVFARSAEVPLSASIASLVVERILDGVVLAILLFATISLPGFPLGEGTGAELIRRTANVGAVAFGLGLAFLWVAARSPAGAARAFDRTLGRVLPERIGAKASPIVRAFADGLGAMRRPTSFLLALAWSFVVWLDVGLSIWAGLVAFGITAPGVTGALFLQSMIAFAVAAPSSPGFFGVFEAAARLGLGLWDIPAATVVSFATSYHILTFIPVTLLGLWFLRRLGLSLGEVERRDEFVEAADDAATGGRA